MAGGPFRLSFFVFSCFIFSAHGTNITDEDYYMMPKLFHLDDYDYCMILKEKAFYCNVQFELEALDKDNPSKIWTILEEVIANPKNYRHDWLRHGICIPKTCPGIDQKYYHPGNDNLTLMEQFDDCYNQKFKELGLKGRTTLMHCETNEPFYKVDAVDITVAVLFFIYFAFIVFSTFYEGLLRYKPKDVYKEKMNKSKFGRYVGCFSLIKNWERLTAESTNPDSIRMKTIQGIRFYNMICIILAHTVMITYILPVLNPEYNEHATDKALNMFIANGSFVVHTFFGISGWLVAFHLFDMTKNKKTISFGYILFAIFNRYIRLLPPLLVVYLISSTWMVHMGNGPMWDKGVGEEYRVCRENGWSNLLFINNYYHKEDMCMPHTWYMAADSQVFIIAIVVTWLMKIYEKHAYKIVGTALAIGTLIPMVINYIYDFDILTRRYPEPLYYIMLKVKQHHIMFNSGYSNIPGYLVGVLFGYIYYKNKSKDIFTKKLYVTIWWIVIWMLPLTTVLIAAIMYDDSYQNSRIVAALYVGLSKISFPLGVILGIYGMAQGQGWFMRWFTEWNPVQVFGRLTYSAYLIHVPLLRIRGGMARTPYFVSDYTILALSIGDITLSYLAATCLCLLVEMPTSALQKFLIPKKGGDSALPTTKIENEETALRVQNGD